MKIYEWEREDRDSWNSSILAMLVSIREIQRRWSVVWTNLEGDARWWL